MTVCFIAETAFLFELSTHTPCAVLAFTPLGKGKRRLKFRLTKTNSWTKSVEYLKHPSPISIMPKWRVFAPSRLHHCFGALCLGGWGIIVPFYSVRNCSSYWLPVSTNKKPLRASKLGMAQLKE